MYYSTDIGGVDAELKEAFIVEEMAPFARIDQLFIDHRLAQQTRTKKKNTIKVPFYLVKLMQVYYVFDLRDVAIAIYATHFFCEAYILWLTLLVKGGIVPLTKLPTQLTKVIQTMRG